MDTRLEDINLLLSEFSLGNFDKRLTLSDRLDEIDAIGNGINMLGEELKAITISRDYFNNIFNSVSDMVFVLDSQGKIEDANKSAEEQLNYGPGCLKGVSINAIYKGGSLHFKNITKELKQNNRVALNDTSIYTRDGIAIPARVHVSFIKTSDKKQLILLTASDITFQMKAENLIIRAIIDTQEKERQRLAKDLHDSLTQQLSAIKFYISTIADLNKNPNQKSILRKSNEALTEAIGEMRNICFNLMPKTLEEFGLINALKEFCKYFLYNQKTNFIIQQNRKLPEFSPALKIDLYRVTQEFINNTVKHANATTIKINFYYNKKTLRITLTDNGVGFDSSQRTMGMGLQNVYSRIKSHNGKLDIISNADKGTQFKITVPVNN